MFFVSFLGENSYLCRAVRINNAAKIVIIFNSTKYFDDNFQLMAKILENLVKLAEKEGITIGALERSIGASKGVLSRAISNGTDIQAKWIEAIVENYPHYSTDWLLTGRGGMLKDFSTPQNISQEIYRSDEKNGIPLIPIDAMAGFFQGEQTVMLAECERYIVPAFKNADFLITVRGDSMTPRYYSGDLIACKLLSLTDIFFQWGKVYVIDTDQGALIKKVEQGNAADTITLVSENTAYKPFEIPRTSIYHIAVVQGLIRAE